MKTSAPSYTRRIGPDEWTYIGMGIPNVCQHVFEGEGELTAEALAAAVEKAGDACPGTRLRRKRRSWIDSGVAPAVRVVNLEPGEDLFSHPALQTTLNDGGATCEVLFVPDEAAGTDADGAATPGRPLQLVFRGFHGITDARGMLLWAANVFQALRGEEPQGAPSTVNTSEFLKQLMPEGLPPIQGGMGKAEWTTPMAPIPRGRRGHIWRRRTVSGNQAAVTAKVIAAIAAATPDSPASRFFVPVDLRRHQPDLRTTGWLSLAVNLDVKPGTGWEQVHQELLTGLAERREFTLRTAPWLLRMPLPLIRVFGDGMEDTARRKELYMGTAFVTSMGSVDLADYSADSFRASTVYILGGSGPSAPPGIDVIESFGRTEIVLTWRNVPGAVERMDALLDVIVEALSPRSDREPAANRTEREPAPSRSLVQLFRDQVERSPEAIALTGPEGDLTYRELSLHSNAVAAELRARGVGRGDVVGVLSERTPAAIAGIWGILRAGAAYLPLDVQHPDARLAGLLADSGARYCLAQAPHQDRDHLPDGCEPISLDDLLKPTGTDPGPEQDADLRPDDLAYVLYTSGSTGQPKGVQIEHGSLLNYLRWGAEEFGVDATTRLPLLTSLSFDVSGTSIFLPLIAGGTVVLVPEQPNHLTLRRLLEESGATMLNLTPSHLELIGRLDIAATGFRSIVVVGEQLRVEVAARAQEMFGPGCRIINEYGPTEATIGCTAHTFDPVRDAHRAAVPIGVPAHNTQVHLLDANRRFVPTGEVGEMYLGGVQLARGYLGRPDLDAERFPRLADGARVYRTGDLARRLPDGGLEFLGRIDDQVKVRGHRVEPAEVADTLEKHPGVDRAVVVARSRPDGSGKALYGYVLLNSEVSPEELQSHATRLLPAYMVPAATFVVDRIPYSVAGKVDVRALPDPFADRADTTSTAAAADPARDGIETRVALIWSGALGIDPNRIDAHTDFHQLGGDSLSLLTMLAGVCREVLPPQLETEFMSQLGRVIAEPTLDTVSAVAREVLVPHQVT